MAQKVKLTSLPQEILRLVLSQSEDIDTLLCAIALCRALHAAFHSFPSPLVAGLVDREISAAVLPHAVQTCRARSIHPAVQLPDTDLIAGVKDVLRHGSQEAASGFKWTLADGIAAIKLHHVVTTLAGTLAAAYVTRMEALVSHQPEPPMSEVEMTRIQCALYRFEMFRYLFPPPGAILGTDFKRAQCCFFDHFKPWENEQLASVHGALWRMVVPAFNDLCLHDISWGEFSIRYVVESDDLFTEQIMSRGLHAILDISRAKTYDERYKLLGCNVPIAAREFLYESFRYYSLQVFKTYTIRCGSRRPRPEPEPETQILGDKGPQTTWEWCHDFRGLQGMVMEYEFMPQRACGYVFWEEGRLARTGWLDHYYRDRSLAMVEDVLLMAPSEEELEASWEQRSVLCNQGLKGYWEGEFRLSGRE